MIPNRSIAPPLTASCLAVLTLLLFLGGALLMGVHPLAAQETDDEVRWRNSAELTYLLNGGNSESSTLGVRSLLRRTSARGELRIDALTRRTDATRISRTAVGQDPDDFRVVEDRETERSAERYSVQTRYDRTLTPRTFAFGGIGWERNTFAGFNHRTVAVTGAGGQWGDDRDWELKVGSGITYTVQRDVTPDPEKDDSFAGLRINLDYNHQLTTGTEAEVQWVVDGNAQEMSDVRADLVQAVSASLTNRLAIKTTLQLKLDNVPPVESVPLVTPDGEVTGDRVLVPLGRADHSLSVALVITL